jgi:RNA polymerase primary sigma factor
MGGLRQLKITKTLTNRDDISLEKYLNEISKERMISAEEEAVLAKKIREGDEVALQTLTKANLRFVVSVAKQFQNKGLTLSDLINEGNIGLIKAARRFDETRGFKFISYAVWWIRQSIIQATYEQSRIVRLPFNQLGNISKVYKASQLLEQQFEREPTLAELSEILDFTESQINDTMRISGRQISVDAPLKDGEDFNLLDTMVSNSLPATDAKLMNESLIAEIDRILERLDPKEKKVIKLYFGVGNGGKTMSLDEIARDMNLTGERIRQIKLIALRKLKFHSKTLLKPYL